MGLNLTKMNLADMAEVGYEFELKVPGTGEPTGAFVTVRGNESKIVKAWIRKKYNEDQMRQKRSRKTGREAEDQSIEDLEEMSVESAVLRIISWKGFEEEDDKGKTVAVPFSKETAERVLSTPGMEWIRNQILEEAGDLTNFFRD